MSGITESVIEEAALDWLAGLGWTVAHGPDIAPDMPEAERTDYGQVVLEQLEYGLVQRRRIFRYLPDVGKNK